MASVSAERGVAVIAIASLVASLGGTRSEADKVLKILGGQSLPDRPSKAIVQVQKALASVRDTRG